MWHGGVFFFFQAEDGIRDGHVTGVQTCALPISYRARSASRTLGRGADIAMIRVVLPAHLRALARVKGEVTVEVEGTASVLSVLDALEAKYPMLEGTIRDHATR